MKIKCLVVDDEPLAREVLITYIEKIDSLELEAECGNAMQAFDILKNKNVDLLFLDIQMPGINGTEFLRNLRNPPKVIFTTAYREYALEGYELDVVDFLLKPITFERFFKAINRYFQHSAGEVIVHENKQEKTEEGFIYVRINKKVHKILLKEILYIESIKDYVKISTRDRKFITKHTISGIEKKLPGCCFLRIHRSFIVNLDHITGFTSHSIDVNQTELPIGRNYRLQVFKILNYTQLNE